MSRLATVSALLVFVLTALPCPAQSADAKDTITPLDVARLRMVVEQQISPDGQKVAYTLRVQRDPLKDENGGAWSELHVVDIATKKSRPFVTGKVGVRSIAWTPDGSEISFLAKRGEDKGTSLYVIPIDGGEARRLLAHDTSISAYDWRPDGNQLAFLATEKEDPEKKKRRDKGFNAEVYEEDLKNTRIWIASAEWNATDKPQLIDIEGSASELHWSPDGKQLVAAVAPTALIDHHYMYRRIRIIDAASGKIVQKIENPGKIGEIAWSPNGKQLAFLSGEDINDPGHGRLFLVDASGGEFTDLTDGYLPDVIDIEWLNDKTIAFLAHNGCLSEIGAFKTSGGEPNLERFSDNVVYTTISLSSDHQFAAATGHSPEHPFEVFVSPEPGPGGTPVRITDVNPWLKEKRLAKQEVVSYKSRDGKTIEGVLTRPLDEEPGRKYPLLLFVHGGPESHVSNGWVSYYSYPGQTAAANGYAVFHPNYRGSTGRGVAFAKDHQADYGGKEFNDLLDGIDHLVEMGLVDRKKVGVTGGSYGGFASAWCATRHSEHFAAAVMFVGISNQISKSGTTDIADEMFHVHARKRIWDDWDFFLKRSPIYYVEKARTPILIMHGKNDTRVHPSQSMELYRNLKILGKTPVRLVFYPGEGHGNRNAVARYDYNLRMLRWMNHYLKGSGGDPPPIEIKADLPAEPAKKKGPTKAD